MSWDVCEGCRRLRKKCEKEECVLQPCLDALWGNSRSAQGYATVFLAKYFGRKRFFNLLHAAARHIRPALFESLLKEACARTINPISGVEGLQLSGRSGECEAAVRTVLNGGTLYPVSATEMDYFMFSGTLPVTVVSQSTRSISSSSSPPVQVASIAPCLRMPNILIGKRKREVDDEDEWGRRKREVEEEEWGRQKRGVDEEEWRKRKWEVDDEQWGKQRREVDEECYDLPQLQLVPHRRVCWRQNLNLDLNLSIQGQY